MIVMTDAVPEQIGFGNAATDNPVLIGGLTVTVSRSVNSSEHEPLVASTLNVVVLERLPVGRLIAPPVPATGVPIAASLASFRN